MPVTPLHCGPGPLLLAAAPRHVSFIAFAATNVLIDVESLYNLVHQRDQVHAFLHTCLGASLVIPAIVLVFLLLHRLAPVLRLPDVFGWRALTVRPVLIGAVLGAYTHVLLDSVMHVDIRPLAPWSAANPLLSVLSLEDLHWACAAAGMVGLIGVGIRSLFRADRPLA